MKLKMGVVALSQPNKKKGKMTFFDEYSTGAS